MHSETGSALFTDVSVNPELKLGIGAALLLPISILDKSFSEVEKAEIAGRVIFRKFEAASSTKLELETVLWALGKHRKELKGALTLYTDSQAVTGLLKRKNRLLARNFISRTTNLPLSHAFLYAKFYSLHEKYLFEVVKLDGHSKGSVRDTSHRIFSVVDQKARRALKCWIKEMRESPPDPGEKRGYGGWCVYVLNCRNGSLYTGTTNDLAKRLKQHECGKGSKYVRSWRPFELVKTVSCKDAGAARKLEYEIKRLTRRKKIEILGLGIESPQ
jgi:ribonuclease HI